MKKQVQLIATLVLIGLTEPGMAQLSVQGAPQTKKIRADVRQRMQDTGLVKVGVVLAVPWALEAHLSKAAVAQQRKAIEAAQHALIAELAGTGHRRLGTWD